MPQSQYKQHQQRYRGIYCRLTKLASTATIPELVIGLVEINHHARAVELLFGCDRQAPLAIDQFAFGLYMHLSQGNNPELTKEIAQHHRWDSTPAAPEEGAMSFQIYHGEWFIVLRPAVASLLWSSETTATAEATQPVSA